MIPSATWPKLILFFATAVGLEQACLGDDFPKPVNTQAPGEHPPAPREMLDLFELPDGFHVTLFAGEPDVRQPIAFDFDDRGRIFVAENYSYSSFGKVDSGHRDRIIILEDTDGDGKHDVRRVFWDQGSMLTGLSWGFGGLWILNDGTLSFIPDKDGDDVPDTSPVEMLNGWTRTAHHNFVNGLMWGPDGWLYGRHGITDSSMPGTPDTPEDERQLINCGIWRFHPTTHVFEIVCHGTTNPWGMDYDKHGQMFMTNNVIGHLWHVIPGARYKRMGGLDFNPWSYELMEPCSDHYHWDDTGKWYESRDGKADDHGGGHSHCGGMIYYGDNFPKEYRGKMFMCNTHGRCVNVDRLEPHESTYVARHEPSFLKVNSPWFRGVELRCDPAGCVYLSDWSDNGECHDNDGVHRTSGRIYRISWGDQNPQPKIPPFISDAARHDVSDDDLLEAVLFERNEWTRRRAARIAVERAASGHFKPRQLPASPRYPDAADLDIEQLWSVNAAWLTLAMAGVSEDLIDEQTVQGLLTSRNEYVRGIGIRLVAEHRTLPDVLGEILVELSQRDPSAHVRLCLASALRRLPFDSPTSLGARVAAALTIPSSNSDSIRLDPQLRRLIWYGIEPNLRNLPHFEKMSDARLRQSHVRRRASDWERNSYDLSLELSNRSQTSAPSTGRKEVWRESTVEFLSAVLEGFRGQSRLPAPARWKKTARNFRNVDDPVINRLVAELSVVFGDGTALADLRTIAADKNEGHLARGRAIHALAVAQDLNAVTVLIELLRDQAVYVDVAQALASFSDPRIPKALLGNWNRLRHGSRGVALDTMCSRRSYALALAKALSDGHVQGSDLTAVHVRQLLAFKEPSITGVLESKWGVINRTSESRTATIARLKQLLSTEVLAEADLAEGAVLFKNKCGNCHRLYGEGSRIGPDLTGANRKNLDYLLVNIVDPSQVVPRQFTTSVIALKSGRIMTGAVTAETPQTLTLQTDREQTVVALAEIIDRQRTGNSLMPDGLLDSLSEEQVRNLVAFVMHRR